MLAEIRAQAKKSRHLLYVQPSTSNHVLTNFLSDSGWSVDLASDPDQAVELMNREQYSVGLVHWDGEDFDASGACRQVEQFTDMNNQTNWVALLDNMNSLPRLLAPVLSRHFYDFHTCPVDSDRLLTTLGHAHGMASIANSLATSTIETPLIEGMLGKSPQMRQLARQIRKVAATDFSVLIRGESGCGKELAASAVHQLSARSKGPYVPVNCGALPRDLIQAELFGHEKGAFTGADHRHIGRIEMASGGTLFLDEIGDLPLELQTNLLRFLQEQTIDRVGGSGQIRLNVRVIAATNVDLEQAVKKGHFREDLYYRLNVLKIEPPPLRERPEDISMLAEAFFRKFSADINPSLKGFSAAAIRAMETHHWPGNVREMVNRVQRAGVMSEGKLITVRDLGLDEKMPCNLMTLSEARSMAEKEAIEATLLHMRNNVSKAARHLGISRVTLYRLMDNHNIDWQSSRE